MHESAAVTSNSQQISGNKRLVDFIRGQEANLGKLIQYRLLAEKYLHLAALTGQRGGLVRCLGWLTRSILFHPANLRHAGRILTTTAVFGAKRRLPRDVYESARRMFRRR